MKKLLLIPVVLIILIIAAIIIVPGLIPSDVYKAKISEQVEKSLGRDVTIAGDVDVSVFPRVSANVSDVTLNNPAGFTGDPFVTMDALSAKVKLLPLLSKRVEIDSFELVSPTITLIKTAEGKTNWSTAGNDAAPKPESEGFKRDAQPGAVQASLGVLKITDGTVSYSDAADGADYKVSDVNVTLAVPDMAKPAKLDGDLVFDGVAMTVTAMLNTPEAFLGGQAAPFDLDLKSGAGDIRADGTFTASDAIALRASIDADIPDTAKLIALAGRDIPYADLADNAAITGEVDYAPDGFTLSGGNVTLKGPLIDGTYTGSFSTLSGAKIDGAIDADVKDLPALLKAVGQDIPQAALVKTANVKAKIGGSPDALAISDVDLTATGDALTAGYQGGLSLAGAPALSGSFTANISDTQRVTQVLAIDIPALKAAQTLDVSGKISGSVSAPKVEDLKANAAGDNLDIDFTGQYSGGDAATLTGAFTADLKSVETFAETAQIDLPYVNVIGGLKASGNLAGPVSALNVAGLNAALSGGLLTASFDDGAVTLGESIGVSGRMSISAESVRNLAAATGTSLPAGDIYGPFELSGTVDGTAQNMRFDDAALSFDAIKGAGSFAMNTAAAKPMVTGNLNITSGLDLAPYAAKSTSQNKTGGLKPWSEQPLDLTPLRAVNADLKLSAPFVKTDRLELGQSEIRATVKNGKLTANIPGAQLYSGTGDITAVLDGSGAVPAASMDIALNSLSAPQFLGATAGFDKVTGLTSTNISLSGSGATQAALMKSLSGSGKFDLTNGALMGINLGEFLGGIESAWTNRSLPSGVGSGQSTEFKDLISGFEIVNGVVTVKDFKLSGKGILAEGGGMLDVGNQKIDFSLRPRLTDEAGNPKGSGLAGFGIPVRLSGGFNNVKAGLDTDLLKDIVAARAKAKAADEIKDRVGGTLGDILGGVIGGQPSAPAPAPTPEPSAEPGPDPETGEATPEKEAPKEKPKEKSDEEKALELLGGIFGK